MDPANWNLDSTVQLWRPIEKLVEPIPDYLIWDGAAEAFLQAVGNSVRPNLIVTSPPYNIGKVYERRTGLAEYLESQRPIIEGLVALLPDNGSICWQVGNYIDNGQIVPLDIAFDPIFRSLGLQLRNRIVWHFGHGLHARRRFSGRYEVVLWYTKTDAYKFNLDPVRVPAKYPGKRHFKGPRRGEVSGHPLGKNPEDVWSIPNVKGNHIEKTGHPCQFPVGLVERLILALTDPADLVLDPFAGVASAGVAAAIHGRRFVGCEIVGEYAAAAAARLQNALDGTLKYRSHEKPVYDHTQSPLSKKPKR